MREKINLRCGKEELEFWFSFKFSDFLVYEYRYSPNKFFVIHQEKWAANLCEINVKKAEFYNGRFLPYDVDIIWENQKFNGYSLLDETTFPTEQLKRILILSRWQ